MGRHIKNRIEDCSLGSEFLCLEGGGDSGGKRHFRKKQNKRGRVGFGLAKEAERVDRRGEFQILEEEEIHQGPQECEGAECRVPEHTGRGLSAALFRCVSGRAGPRKGLGSPLPDVLNLLSKSGMGHQRSSAWL